MPRQRRSSRPAPERRGRRLSAALDAGYRCEADQRPRSPAAGTTGGMDRRPPPRAPDSGHHEVASDLGAENWAMLASLIETCKLHGVNPEVWLADVLTRLVGGWPNRRLAELTPWAWQAARNGFERVAA